MSLRTQELTPTTFSIRTLKGNCGSAMTRDLHPLRNIPRTSNPKTDDNDEDGSSEFPSPPWLHQNLEGELRIGDDSRSPPIEKHTQNFESQNRRQRRRRVVGVPISVLAPSPVVSSCSCAATAISAGKRKLWLFDPDGL
ncbi:hypothetical protein C1H46_015943 [Malus baccata]|uniref:Uncharacterized protein n=1 Tax=Malus baccata TaxID=106549 RepID=A0A540MI77_MALBA|nr:hypothetical protein C1H46_015943 [Malus baccata]